MGNYGLSRENARKGPLSRAIATEIAEGRGTPHGGIYYDMTMLPEEMIVKGHSIFYVPAKAAGLDITKVPAEMAPASHTFMGGVAAQADTSTEVKGLFVCGEVMGGVHGADRIGGNAGAEVLVFGHLAGESAAEYIAQVQQEVSEALFSNAVSGFIARHNDYRSRTTGIPASELRSRLTEVMDKYVSILREEAGLKAALTALDELDQVFDSAYADGKEGVRGLYECANLLLFGRMQVMASLLRRESRGVFTRIDYPERDDATWKKNIVFHLENGAPVAEICEIK